MKILIVGASGMIGSAVMCVLSKSKDLEVYGSIRDEGVKEFFSPAIKSRLISGIDLLNSDSLLKLFESISPQIVINCAGITKHKLGASNPLVSLPINSLMPHRIALICGLINARLIHISTDCVFSGGTGNYDETDSPDAIDLYGKSKELGEVNYPHAITLRTSTIGHEFKSSLGLLEWFLSQKISCKGYINAIFSGLPTVVLADIIREVIIPHPSLSGLYHVGARKINKFELLKMIAKEYQKKIEIRCDESLIIDRSLDSSKFEAATGYVAPEWPKMISLMHSYKY